MNQISSNLYERQGKAITNFDYTLPAISSDLAKEITKDPYNFDFIEVRDEFGYNQPIIQDTFKPDRTTLTVFSVKKDDTKHDTKQPKLDTKYSTNENKIIIYLSNVDKAKAKDIAYSVGVNYSAIELPSIEL